MPKDETAVAINKQTEVLQEIAAGIAESNEIARARLEQELKDEKASPLQPNGDATGAAGGASGTPAEGGAQQKK